MDFVCLELKLNLEVDGQDYLTDKGQRHAQKRDDFVQQMGFEVLRIPGFRVIQVRFEVQEEIARVIRELKAQIPSPPSPYSPQIRRCLEIDGKFLRPDLRGEGEPVLVE